MSSKSRGGLSKREYKKKYGKSAPSSKSSSKSRGGLSKREYSAKQASTKINSRGGVGNKSYGPTQSGLQSGPSRAGEVSSGYYNPYTRQAQIGTSDYDTDTKSKSKSKSKSSSSSKPSQRSSASRVFNKLTGTKTANAQGRGEPTITQGRRKGVFERGLEILKDPLGLEPRGRSFMSGLGLGNKIYQSEEGAGDAISQALRGVTPQLDVSQNIADADQSILDRRREETGYDINAQERRPYIQYADESIEDFAGRTNRPAPRQTDDNGSSISEPQSPLESALEQFQPEQQFVEPEPADGGAIQYDNPTVSRIAGKGNYARGLGYNSEQGLVGGGGLGLGGEDDEMNILQKILASTGMINSAQASQVPRDNGGFSGQKDYSYNSATIPTNYGYQAENPEGPAPIIQPQEEEPIEYNQTNNQNYEQDYTGGGGNMNAPADRGGLSKREYAAKYGQEWDPSGGLGDFGYAGDDSYDDQYSEQKRQLADMIKGIESQYATAQTKQTGDLERQGRQNLNQLNSQFSFGNSDPNDEQRIQYQQRLQNDQGRNLAELLSSLQAAKGQDILSARNQGSTNMQNLMNQQRQARSTAQGNQRDFQTAQAKARSGGSTPKSYGTALDGIMKQYGVDATTARKIYNQKNGLVSQDPLSALLGLGAEGGFTGQPVGQGNSQIEFEGKLYNVDSIGNMSPA